MTELAAQIAEQRQLLRLRKLREEADRCARESCRAALDAAHEEVRAGRDRLSGIRRKSQCLSGWGHAAPPGDLLALGKIVEARQESLKNSAEAAAYDLSCAQESLQQSEAAYQESHAQWIRSCSRTRSVEQLLERTRRRAAVESELRAERESEPTRMLSFASVGNAFNAAST